MLSKRLKNVFAATFVAIMAASLVAAVCFSVNGAKPVSAEMGARSYYNSSSGDVFLGGNYIELGISRHGIFGTQSSAPSNFKRSGKQLGMIIDKDGFNVGNAPTTGDFFLPGTPEERFIFAYEYNGSTYQYKIADRNDGVLGSWKQTLAATNKSEGDMLCAEVYGETTHGVKLTITYKFGVDDMAWSTYVNIENCSDRDISNVRFVRSFDPDQDQETKGTYDTYNKVLCNAVSDRPSSDTNYSMVVARGASTLEGFFFVAFDNRARVSRGVEFALSSAYATGLWYDDASIPTYATDDSIDMSVSNVNGYTKEDNAIAITFALGTLEAGSGATDLEYFSSLAPDVSDSLDLISRPIAPSVISSQGAELEHGYTDGSISVGIREKDGYDYTYQWYLKIADSSADGVLIEGATSSSYTLPVGRAYGTTEYYYCVIVGTRRDNLRSATTVSAPIAVVYLEGEHDFEDTVLSEPTCTIAGEVYRECKDCPYTCTEVLPALGHDNKTIEEVKADCENDGYVKYKCSRCGNEETVVFKALGHDYSVKEEVAASCETSGYILYECAVCGKEKITYLPALGHSYASTVVKEATCTESGLIRYACTRCGEGYETITTSEHRYELVETKAANCKEEGYQLYRCVHCGDENKKIIPAAEAHAYVSEIVLHATKEEDGLIRYTCPDCGKTYEETIPAFGDGEFVLLVQDDMPWSGSDNVTLLNGLVAKGYIAGWDMTTSYAVDASMLDKYSVIFVANDQRTSTYSALRSLESAFGTFFDNGGTIIYGSCGYGWNNGTVGTLPGGVVTVCNITMNNYIVDKNHPVVTGSYTDGKGITDALLTGTYCSHVSFDKTTLPEGYNVILQDSVGNPTLVEYPIGNGRVIASGLTWEFYYGRSYQGDTTYSKNVYDDLIVYALNEASEHVHVYDGGVVTPATCTEAGFTTHVCEQCGSTYVDNIVPALGHDIVHHEGKAATCTESGHNAYDACSRCDLSDYEEIAPLGHDIVHHEGKAATCTESGYNAYDTCSRCDYSDYEEIAPLGHDYAFAGFVWDGETAQAKFVCKNDAKHVLYFEAKVEKVVMVEADADHTGLITYIVTYEGYSDTKDEITEKTEPTDNSSANAGTDNGTTADPTDPTAPSAQDKEEPSKEKSGGCSGAVSGASALAFIAIAVLAVFALRKRKARE